MIQPEPTCSNCGESVAPFHKCFPSLNVEAFGVSEVQPPAAAPPHPFSVGTEARYQHDIETRDIVISSLTEKLDALQPAAATQEPVKLLEVDDVRAWLKVSEQRVHIGVLSFDFDHARRLAHDILELIEPEPVRMGGHQPECRWDTATKRNICIEGCEIKRINDSVQPAAAQQEKTEAERGLDTIPCECCQWPMAYGVIRSNLICPCCGYEPEYDSEMIPGIAGYREAWVTRGMPWFYAEEPKPLILQPAAAAPPIDLLDLEPIKRRILIHDEEIENSSEISYAEWEENNDYLADNDVKGLLAEVERLRGVLARLRALQGSEQ